MIIASRDTWEKKKTFQLNHRFHEEQDYFYLLPRGFVHCSFTITSPFTRRQAEAFFEKRLEGYSTFIDTPEKLIEYLREGYSAWRKSAIEEFEKCRLERMKIRGIFSAHRPSFGECGILEQTGKVVKITKKGLYIRSIINYRGGSFGYVWEDASKYTTRIPDPKKRKNQFNRLTKAYRQAVKKKMKG